jgi:hypothetical protein
MYTLEVPIKSQLGKEELFGYHATPCDRPAIRVLWRGRVQLRRAERHIEDSS